MENHKFVGTTAGDQKKEGGGNSIFVRGLAGNATGEQLEALFSGVGPIRRSFVVTDRASKARCTGSGFVHFALREDAAKALQILQGASLGGRRLKLDFARRRQRGAESADNDGGLRAKQTHIKFSVLPEKIRGKLAGSVASRTVVVKTRMSGMPLDSKILMNKLGEDLLRIGYMSSVLSADGTSMRLLFRSWPQAGAAAARIHCVEFDAVVDAQSGGRKCKLIVRNLPFKIRPAELRCTFEQVAPVREVSIPSSTKSSNVNPHTTSQSEENIVCSRGFGFVEYFLVADANRAIEKINGTKIGSRVVAVDLAIGKSEFVRKVSSEEAVVNHDIATELKEIVTDGKEQPATFDVEKEELPEEKSSQERASGETGKKPESTAEEMTRTVFIRNLLFETTAPELRAAMETRFGAVEQAVVVKDPMTGRPRGTAFVRFKSAEDTKAAITPIPNSFDGLRIPSSRNFSTFSLQGRDLLISHAVNRDSARDMVVGSSGKKDKPDRRNMRLAWIGHIKPGSTEARGLSEADMGKRAKAEKEKRNKLNSNPNAFVSDIRLCVRNLPKSVDEKFLKHMCLALLRSRPGQSVGSESQKPRSHARISHTKIVRDTTRNDRSKGFGFVQFEEHRHALQALHKLNNNPTVLETLIELQPKVLEIDEGKARLLRKEWSRNRRLIVEFSVEDSRQVAVLNKIKEKGRVLKEEAKATAHGKEALDGKKRRPKRRNSSRDAGQNAEGENVNSSSRKGLKREFDETNDLNKEDMTEETGNVKEPRRKRNRSKQKKQGDKFDKLVSDYKRKLVSDDGGS